MKMNSQKICIALTLLLALSFSVECQQVTNVIPLKVFVDTLNDFRTNPRKFAAKMRARILDNLTEENVLPETNTKFKEGRASIEEAIAFLEEVEPVPALTLDQGLTNIEWHHSMFQIEQNEMKRTKKGPKDANPSVFKPKDRAKVFNTFDSDNNKKVRELIINADSEKWDCSELLIDRMIIDDGRKNRKRRKVIFSNTFQSLGVGIYPYTKSKTKKNGTTKTKIMDRITILFTSKVSCPKCDTITKTISDKICWSNFTQGDNTCDLGNLVNNNRRLLISE